MIDLVIAIFGCVLLFGGILLTKKVSENEDL